MRRTRPALPSFDFLTPIFATLILASLFVLAGPMAQAQSGAPILITQSVDNSKLVTLAGNTRPEANKQNDRGLVADSLAMEHMLLQLKRSPQQEQALLRYIDQLQEKSSPNFHHWLTAKQYGQRFGLAKQDLNVITRWLESQGFKVNVVYTNGVLIDFSGTAGQVHAAFHTEIHNLDVKGVNHIANMSDPQIPAALAPAVVGVVSLHDFKPHTNYKPRANYTDGECEFGTCYLVVPGDLATIYNLTPLFTASISGQGQTIVVIEDTDVYSTADWTTFRSTFGLSSFTGGSFTQVHPAPPSGPNNCTDPGVNGDDGEAILDAEYASAAAPSAAIELASCNDTSTFGGLIAIQNLLADSNTPPAVMSMSYGECETFNGSASNQAFSSTFQQAVSEGVSFFVSSGDEGAASCNADEDNATYGIGVSGFASTPYNVAVGGTDFGDTYAGTNSTYWGNSNSATYESALSYVPEIPWNDSCASVVISEFLGFGVQTYGLDSLCNAGEGLTTSSGSGGPSGCATGSPAVQGVVGGTCAGWAKPSWQSLVGNPSDLVRDLPDVSLFAANGVWDHYLVFCYSDPRNGGAPCTGAPDNWSGGGGTSFSSPIMAGIQALVNQNARGPQGNPNPIYYQLAATEYGAGGDTSCNSTLGNGVASSCIFYDVTLGDMDINCTGTNDCYLPSGTYGVLSTSDGSYLPAYGTQTGWDFATGIGTVNAANLVNGWPAALSATTTTVASSQNPQTQGVSVTFTATVTTLGSNTPTGTVTFYDGNTSIGTGSLTALNATQATATLATSALPVGSNSITAGYGGDSNNAQSTSLALNQVINGTFSFASTGASSLTVLAGQTTSTTGSYAFLATPTSAGTFGATVTFACGFAPTDPTLTTSSCTFSPTSIAAGAGATTVTMTITSKGPNTGIGQPGQKIRQRRADNRSPWLPLTLPLAGIVVAGVAGRKVWKHSAVASLCVSLMLLGLLVACGGGSSPAAPIVVAVSPGTALYPNYTDWPSQTESFTATVTGTNNTAVTWTLSSSTSSCPTPYTTLSQCGQLSSTTASPVTYTAPTIASGLPSGIVITATSAADTTKSGQTAFNLTPATVPGTYTVTVTATEAATSVPASGVSLVVN
ncbi:MAG: protease pro-enzyme activation domain-containing protein [Terriglobales bacterium]